MKITLETKESYMKEHTAIEFALTYKEDLFVITKSYPNADLLHESIIDDIFTSIGGKFKEAILKEGTYAK